MGCRKQEFHIDEIYSYILSNSYHADKISSADWMWGEWIEGKEFDPFITVQDGETFSYDTVYLNNSTDCHPPLFYWILHSVCSIFPNQFSKWFGLSINIIFFIITSVFIFMISNILIQNEKLKYIPIILYGFSCFAIDTCTFIRMYMLLTMLVTIFVYVHVLMFKRGIDNLKILLTMLLIYLGAMTQYYFIILSFWGVLLFSIYLYRNKKIKEMLKYTIGAFLSVCAMVVTYPAVIIQATGSSTNNIGNEVLRNLFNFKLKAEMVISLAKQIIFNISFHWILSLIIVGVMIIVFIVLLINKIKSEKSSAFASIEMRWMVEIFILVFLSISFIGGEYVFLRYAYFIMPIFYISSVYLFDRISGKYGRLQTAAAIICILFALSNATLITVKNCSSFIFLDSATIDSELAEYKDEKLIVIVDQIGPAIPTGNLTKYELFDDVYMDTLNNIVKNNIFEKCLQSEQEFVVYIATDTYWLNGFEPEKVFNEFTLQKQDDFEYTKIADGTLGEYYLINS